MYSFRIGNQLLSPHSSKVVITQTWTATDPSPFCPVSPKCWRSTLTSSSCIIWRLTISLTWLCLVSDLDNSCITATFKVLNDTICAIDNKQYCASFVDLAKAFDLVNHNILLDRLRDIGLSENCLAWFKSYCSGWLQSVRVEGLLPTHLPLSNDVPQGSILGPTLFNIYINNLRLITLIYIYMLTTLSFIQLVPLWRLHFLRYKIVSTIFNRLSPVFASA